MKTEIMTKAGRFLGRVGLQLKKHSPEIFMVAGVVGTVTSTVMACKATTKVNDILEPTKDTIDIVHKGMEDGYIENEKGKQEYTQEDGKKDLTIIYTQTGIKLAKLYAPSVALGVISIAGIVTGHHILKKRNLALAAGYALIDKSFKEYRKNVVDRFGEAIDKELRYSIKAQEVEEIVVDENGNQTVEKTIINVPGINASPFAKFFEESCPSWTKDPQYNLMFLRKQQDYANELLKARGHVFLNEVYDMIGIQRTPEGQTYGWVYDEKDPIGDNFIDFGIYDVTDERKRAFVNGYERNILLDFNVDGSIYNLIGKYQK